MKYRADIDGLRTYAVLPVVLFHAGFDVFSGGFVGVDVFFVISGYLITSLIVSEVENSGRFDFGRFYVRRIRRLFPALVATVLISFVAAAYWLPPYEFRDFAASAFYSLVSVSNIYFWSSVSYFDVEATSKPLLHTWSLSVEEQFYLIWPAVLFFAARRFGKFGWGTALAVVTIASLALSMAYIDDRSAIYYLLPFRAFELGIGGLAFLVAREIPAKRLASEGLVVVGLAMILYCVFAYNEKTVFPAHNALLPCVGAALALYGGQARFAGLLLRNAPAVWIGRVSYSFYLIHWPVVVFYGYATFDQFSWVDKSIMAGASLALAVAMYFLIEERFRHEKREGVWSGQSFALSCSGIAIVLIVTSANASNSGWSWRFPEAVARELDQNREENNRFVWEAFRNRDIAFPRNGRPNILVFGDSQAGDLTNVLIEAGADRSFNVRSIPTTISCQPIIPASDQIYTTYSAGDGDRCRQRLREVKNDPRIAEADYIFLAGAWSNWAVPEIDGTIAWIKAKSRKPRGIILWGAKSLPRQGVEFLAKTSRQPGHFSVPIGPGTEKRNQELRNIAARHEGVTFMNPQRLYCDDNGCPLLTKDRYLIIPDFTHFSRRGVRLVAGSFREKWLGKIAALPKA
jgi:peptidoglycan/LPS O-acetylase OafA/YrhL